MYAQLTAKVAVSAATYAIDRPYDYTIPDKLRNAVMPGLRVVVPFGRGNRRCEAIVLSVSDISPDKPLKAIESALDDSPVLSAEQLKLALWMRDRFFCTVYDAVHAMLPSGMWFKDGGKKIGDKTVTYVGLSIPAEEAAVFAEQKKMRAPQQSSVLRLMASVGYAPMQEVMYFTGASRQSITALVKQGLLTREEVEVYRRPQYASDENCSEVVLSTEQQSVFDSIKNQMNARLPSAALLFGVTGSGKTSIYINLIKDVIKNGRTAIVLVPEISLTPQFVSIFSAHFGDNIAVLHSSLGIGQRYDEWKRIKSGKVKVVIGTRSAVFAPVENLGLIIIDEEQEHTYKSESAPRYHARDIAKYRCVQSNAFLLLGSATPSVESMYSARNGKYTLYTLKSRYNKRDLPEVIIADMKKELKRGNGTYISSPLMKELRKNIDRGEQSILFINRRGASSQVVCGECGYVYTCPRCSVSMTYHLANNRLMCHYCGTSIPVDGACPQCGGKLSYIGVGTQKIQEELQNIFPDIDIMRMDMDTVAPSGSHEKLLSKFKNDKIPILIGTQMVTKGLDFENVTLVGVILADQSLYVNDYKAYERTFSLITQVIGRSGRGDKPGRAVIQTFTPENNIIRLAAAQDYESFFESEIELRKVQQCPPLTDMFSITVTGINEEAVMRGCAKMSRSLKSYFAGAENIRILGPSPDIIAKINNRFRYKITINTKNTKTVRNTISHLIREFSKDKMNRGLTVFADINPSE